jgi:hypothetical protein
LHVALAAGVVTLETPGCCGFTGVNFCILPDGPAAANLPPVLPLDTLVTPDF